MDIHNQLSQMNAIPTDKGVWDSAFGTNSDLNYKPVQQIPAVDYDKIKENVTKGFEPKGISPDVQNIVNALRSSGKTASSGWVEIGRAHV